MKNKYFLYVEGDTNEGNYIGKLSELGEISENEAKDIARKISSFHDYNFINGSYDVIDPSIDEDEAAYLKERFLPYNDDCGGYCYDVASVELIKGEVVPF